jgi:hypothetical protein
MPSLTHGARAELRVRDVEYQQRHLTKAIGTTWGELSPIARGLITNLSRIRVQLRLLDKWIAAHRPDFVDDEGNLPPFSAYHIALLNSERNALTRLAQHLPVELTDPMADVRAWLEGEVTEES